MSNKYVSNLNCYFENTKLLINKHIHFFLYSLIKEIILISKKTTNSIKNHKKLKQIIDEINKNILKEKTDNYLSLEYSKKNLKNILLFIKSQNNFYAGEIFENILIIVFSHAFETRKENTFGKYLYNNMHKIRDPNNINFVDWFKQNMFKPDELREIKILLENDIYFYDEQYTSRNIFQRNAVIYDLLLEINKEKNSNRKNLNINDYLKDYINESYINDSQYSSQESNDLNERSKYSGRIVRSFFISVYIYYQNKNSPLMKYREEVRDNNNKVILSGIPFTYDLTGAVIESDLAGIIFAPARIEPRINEIIMSQNLLKGEGLLELSKVLIFNKNIKIVDFHTSAIKSEHINYLNKGFGLFDNYSLEELNLSCNYIREDSINFLSKLISHLKGLKSLNLSTNDLKNGVCSLFIALNKLYKEGKTNLESLNLNKCLLDDIAIYELGELLKSKYCKLQTLFLNINNMPSDVDIIKKIKKNKSLTEIYFNKSNLGNSDSDNIMKFISYTNIENIYLFKNYFSDFNQCLRILYRTKLITTKEEDNIRKNKSLHEDSLFYNLDISNNEFLNKNKEKVILLDKGIEQSNLYCIDLSHILYGNSLRRRTNNQNIKNGYDISIDTLTNRLNKEQKEYESTLVKIHCNKVDIDKFKNFSLNTKPFPEDIEKEISEIIKDKNSEFHIFLKESAKKIIIKNKNYIDPNNTLTNKEYKNFEQKLENYMIWKKALIKLTELSKLKKEKKLVLI